MLLIQYAGGPRTILLTVLRNRTVKWPRPCCCWPSFTPDIKFLNRLRYGLLQFTIIVPLLSLETIVLNSIGLYEHGTFADIKSGYIWITVLKYISQFIGGYSFAWVFFLLRKELQPFSPVYKIIALKLGVIFPLWQSVHMGIFVRLGWISIDDGETYTAEQIQIGWSQFLLCIEIIGLYYIQAAAFNVEVYRNSSYLQLVHEREKQMLDSEADNESDSVDLESNSVDDNTVPLTVDLLASK
jgi:hypothetical protein